MIVKHRRGTTKEWRENNIIPEAGELVIEECDDGTRRAKFGTGYQYFSDLPYIDDALWAEIDHTKSDLDTKITKIDDKFSKVLKEATDSITTRLASEKTIREKSIADLVQTAITSDAQLRKEAAERDVEIQEKIDALSEKLNARMDSVNNTATLGIESLGNQLTSLESTFNGELVNHTATFDKQLGTAIEAVAEDYNVKITALAEDVQAASDELSDLTSQVKENKEIVADFCRDTSNRINSVKENLITQIAVQAKRIDDIIVPSEGEPVTNEDIMREFKDLHIGYDGEYHETAGSAVRDIGNKLNELEESLISRTVNGLHYEDNQLYLTSDGKFVGKPVTITGGGSGGGGGGYVTRLYTSMATDLTVAKADTIYLTAAFYEKFDRELTGLPGILSVSYRLYTGPGSDAEWVLYNSRQVEQDKEFSVDIAPLLNLYDLGTEVEISFKVIAGESKKESELTFIVSQIEAYIEPIEFNNEQLFTKDFKFYYKCIGKDLKKTVYFDIDGKPCASSDVGTSHNATLDIDIPITKYEHGVHYLTIYYKTPEGATSDKEQFILLYNDGTSTNPMIGASCSQPNITYGDTLKGEFMVSTPNKETTDSVSIRLFAYDENGISIVYYERDEQDIANNTLIPWEITNYPFSGEAFISFTSGADEKIITVNIKKSDSAYDLNPIKSGLIYEYNASGKTNTTVGKESYEYSYIDTETKNTATIDTTFEGFNWISNGYPAIEGEETALVLSGPAKHTIKLPMFASSYKDKFGSNFNLGYISNTGRTFEIEFKVSNVTDANAPIITCMSKNDEDNYVAPGFILTPQVCYLLQRGAVVETDETGFIKNEAAIAAAYIKDNSRVRVAFVIEKQHVGYTYNGIDYPGQCINVYVNGQFANSLPYPDGADFSQNEFITIGSNTCITRIYEVRIYNRGLSAADILQNYKASPQSVNDKLSRFEANDILDDHNNVDYDKAIKKYPCLLFTGELSTYTGKNDGSVDAGKAASGITLTKPDSESASGYRVEFELLDKDSNGKWLSSNKIQGTTSKTYPIKNYKAYLAKADGVDQNGKVKSKKVKYSLKGKDANGNDLSIGESTLCWKCDYMSTDHANTFNANLADTLFDDTLISQDPTQGGDSRVQNTIYGFRCLLFQRDDEYSPINFIGDGALNNDKSNAATFGLKCEGDEGNDTTRQKWEIRNNTELISTFESDKLFEPNGDNNKAYAALESTYPDQGDLEDAGLAPNYNYIQTLYTWVCQRANFWDASTEARSYKYKGQTYNTEREYRKAIFINEFEKHFNKNHALVYYLFCEFTALCDNRAKNMFLRSEDVKCEKLLNTNGEEISIVDAINPTTGEVNADMIDWENSKFATWITDLYDLDSCYGVENTGKLEIPYYADWRYELNGTKKFNSYESRLWLMFEEAFAEDIKKKAQALTSTSLNYETVYESHIKENALNTCPAVVNRDMEFKYHDPWIAGFTDYTKTPFVFKHDSTFKYLQRGSRAEQKDSFIFKRFNMLYSKYLCNKCTSNQLNFRCATAIDANDSTITLEANQVFYPAIRYGDADFISGNRTNPNESVSITGSSIKGEDFIYIGGASYLTDIGDISKFKPYQLDLGSAASLKRLILGSDTVINDKINALELSNCPLLEELNIVGCIGLRNANVDLSANKLLRKVSTSTYVKLPNGGILEELNFRDPERIEVLNQTTLKTFTYTGTGPENKLNNLYKLWVENTPAIPALALASEYLSKLTSGLRLIGVNETLSKEQLLRLASADALNKYINIKGDLSTDQQYPHISGTCTVTDILTGAEYAQVKSIYPNLDIKYQEMHTNVTFKYQDSTGKAQEKVITLTLKNSGIGDLTDSTDIPEAYWPTDDAFTYTFKGWSEKHQPNNGTENTENDWKEYFQEDALQNIVGNRTLYPVFEAIRRSYIVTFINPTAPEGSQVRVVEVSTPYGSEAKYPYAKPTKQDANNPNDYEFTRWYPYPVNITGPLTCYAQFKLKDEAWYTLDIDDITGCRDNDEELFDGYILNVSNNTMTIIKYDNFFNAAVKIPENLNINGNNYEITKLKGIPERAGVNCFSNHPELELVKLPNTLVSLGRQAFWSCSALTELELPDSLQNIESQALQLCTELETITIPANVHTIGSAPFCGCYGLKNIVVAEGNNNFKVIGECLIDDRNDKLLQGTPAGIIDTSVKSLSAYCFHYMPLTSVAIPEGVTEVPDNAFSHCEALKAVTLPSTLTKLDSACFSWCFKLAEITLHEGLTDIKTYVFYSSALTNVTIPASVNNIENKSFGEIKTLQTVTFNKALETDDEGNTKIKLPNITSEAFLNSGTSEKPIVFNVPWSKEKHMDNFADAPTFGAANAVFNYDYVVEEEAN